MTHNSLIYDIMRCEARSGGHVDQSALMRYSSVSNGRNAIVVSSALFIIKEILDFVNEWFHTPVSLFLIFQFHLDLSFSFTF